MRVAIISKSDAAGGGASRKAGELVELLNAAGHTAHHWVSYIKGEYKPYHRFLYGSHYVGLLTRIRNASGRLGYIDLPPVELLTLLRKGRLNEYDIVHFHDISSAISPLTIRYVARRRPTVWTFRDCSPFTGGCLNPEECTAFRSRCGHCPKVGKEWPLNTRWDRTGFLQDIKRRTASEGKFAVATPSQWMADMAMSAGFLRREPVVVPNGISLSTFQVGNRPQLRHKLGLSADRKIVLLSAQQLDDPRKGLAYATDALRMISDLNPLVLCLGGLPSYAAMKTLAGIDFLCRGNLLEASMIAECYAVSDVYLCPYLADNLPSTVLEAMACGLPVVAFATGGIPEMVQDGVNGRVVPQRDSAALAAGLREALADSPGKEWALESRRIMEAKFTDAMMRDNYLELYQNVLKDRAE